MAAFGVVDFRPPAWMAEQEEEDRDFYVLGENWEAVNVFIACATQWRTDRNDKLVGLPYDVVDVVMQRMHVSDPDDAFWRLRAMESAVLGVVAKQRNA